MNYIKYLLTVITLTVLTGCAHSYMISPDSNTLAPSEAAKPSPKNVAYYIPAELLSLEVTTPGGGGDKVTYKPYKDLEPGFYRVLANNFANVTKLNRLNDADTLAKHKIDYVIQPKLVTNSSSGSMLTWPPTVFSIELSCTIYDAKGQVLFTPKVVGEGTAQFDEFKHDFSLAGKRAAADALLKLQAELQQLPR
ncbi:MAG: hypothetical protein KBC57_11500 [Neisseriaceae bacterium]|nr:hypothetical protein [Neisseriaceae bacterium]